MKLNKIDFLNKHANEVNKEKTNLRLGYLAGAIIFTSILIYLQNSYQEKIAPATIIKIMLLPISIPVILKVPTQRSINQLSEKILNAYDQDSAYYPERYVMILKIEENNHSISNRYKNLQLISAATSIYIFMFALMTLYYFITY